MPAEALITIPIFKIEIDGSEIPTDVVVDVESVRFEEDLNTASMFDIVLQAYDFEKGTWRYIDLKTFSLGREVKLYMGMDDAKIMMTGEITSIRSSFGENTATIEIRGYDRMHRLRFGTKRRTFMDMKDSDVASKIAGDWGLSAKVEDTGTVHRYLYQNNQSDLEFILHRARLIRCEMFVNDKTLYFRQPKENESASMTLEFMADFSEFSVELSARYEGDEVKVQGWDFKKKEQISAKATEGNKVSKMSAKETGTGMTKSAFGGSSSSIVDEYLVDASHAEKLAIARYNTHLVESVTGDGSCAGNPGLRAGKTIEIKGIGRFSGTYYVTSTTHTIDSNGYKTSFKVRRVGV